METADQIYRDLQKHPDRQDSEARHDEIMADKKPDRQNKADSQIDA